MTTNELIAHLQAQVAKNPEKYGNLPVRVISNDGREELGVPAYEGDVDRAYAGCTEMFVVITMAIVDGKDVNE